jgi:hypothetical protein
MPAPRTRPSLADCKHLGEDGRDFDAGVVYSTELSDQSGFVDCANLIERHLALFSRKRRVF